MEFNNQDKGSYIKCFICCISMALIYDFVIIAFAQDEMNIILFLISIIVNIFFGVLPLYLLIKYWQDLKEKDKIWKQHKKIEKEIIKKLSPKERIKRFLGSHIEITICSIVIVLFLLIFIPIGAYIENNKKDNNYIEDRLCRTYTNAHQKCHYSYREKRCVCKDR